jgi:ActR/RegA family two-component response regulator
VRNEADDDRDSIQEGDQVLLIVENDLAFARFLLDAARAKGFKGLVTPAGAGALTLANQFQIAPSRWTCTCRTWTAGACSTA